MTSDLKLFKKNFRDEYLDVDETLMDDNDFQNTDIYSSSPYSITNRKLLSNSTPTIKI